jgi:hypothetical protein
VVLVVTHEGMMATDFACAAAAPWHARVDEVPSATVAGEFRVLRPGRYFETAYDLAPVPSRMWWEMGGGVASGLFSKP